MPHQNLLDLSILSKKEKLNREGDITVLLKFTVQGSCIMEIDSFIKAFGFAMDVVGSTRRCTIVDKFIIIVLKHIMTPLVLSIGVFHV